MEPHFSPAEVSRIRSSLLAWFVTARRELPWRGDSVAGAPALPRTPYGVWVSEVMLQQTRVAAVVTYWVRWMARFPTLASLAAASLDEVNVQWAGLGFYRRAANLHKGAQHVVAHFGGALPASVEALTTVPGIGPYTAGAIASIAFGAPEALVDGNVVRVLARLRAIPLHAKAPALHKQSWRLARELVPQLRAGDFNEALMELGATVCVPKGEPRCGECPLRSACLGFQGGAAAAGSAGSAGSASGDIEDVGAIAGWVAERYPAAPAPKAATPRVKVVAVVIEQHTQYLMVRSSAQAMGSGSGGGGALLSGQWTPVAMPAEGDAAGEEAEARGAGKGKKRRAGAAPAAAAAKRPHKSSGGPADATEAAIVSVVERVLGIPGLALCSSGAAARAGSISFAPVSPPQQTSHTFSHVIHDLTVHHLRLHGDPQALLRAVTCAGLEVRWCDVATLANGLGLTSWAAKVLFVALKDQARAALSTASTASASSSASGALEAWQSLKARWEKCGAKL